LRLSGKTAIVTGGASGFGAGIAAKFIAEGAQVMIADINETAAQTVASELGANAVGQTVDVSNGPSVQTMATAALDAFGHVDILINNAGVTHLPTALESVS
jgi:3-oxoacyl-[acyl-carrier protein] reductase